MDPYTFARQQGQVAGSSDQFDSLPTDAEDLMDLLIGAFDAAGHLSNVSQEVQEVIAHFGEFSNDFLAKHRVISTGVVDGAFSLVFEGGQAVPLASTEPTAPARPDSAIPITSPRDSKIKGMPVTDSSVPITTGNVGSPTRRPG